MSQVITKRTRLSRRIFLKGLTAAHMPVIVGVDRAMSLQDGLLTAASHLLFASEQVQETAGIAIETPAPAMISGATRRR